jgi:hypothetical protein
MAFMQLAMLGKLDSELSQGKYLDEIDKDIIECLGWKDIFEYVNKYFERFPHLGNEYFKYDFVFNADTKYNINDKTNETLIQ